MNNHGYIGGGVVRMISPMIHVNQHGWSTINILEVKPWECCRSVHWWPTMKLLVRREGWLLQYLNAIMDNNRCTWQGWWCIMNSCYNEIIWGDWAIHGGPIMDTLGEGLMNGNYNVSMKSFWVGWAIHGCPIMDTLGKGLMNGNYNESMGTLVSMKSFEWVELSMDVQSWIPWGRGLMNGNYNGSMGNHGYICSTQYLTCR